MEITSTEETNPLDKSGKPAVDNKGQAHDEEENEETNPPGIRYDKSGKPAVNNKGQAHEEKANESDDPTSVDEGDHRKHRALSHIDNENKHVEPRRYETPLPEQHKITNHYDTKTKVISTKETIPLEKQKILEKQLDGETETVKTKIEITSAEETDPLDKSGKPAVDNKGQAHDEEANKSDNPTTVETNGKSDDNIYFECTCQEFSPGKISGISTCQECNTSYSFEDLEWMTGTYCSRYFNSSKDTVCGNNHSKINHGDLKAHMKNVHCAKPLENEYDKSDKHVVDNKEQVQDEEPNKSDTLTSVNADGKPEDTIYYHCDACRL